MRCQFCNENEATIHLTEIVEGKRRETHLCEQCAANQGVVVKSQVPINELLSGLLASQPSDDELFGTPDKKLSCPHCGFTLEQFRKEAVLGCPNDYETFENSLLPLIEKAHNGKTFHCGKVPSHVPEDSKKQMQLSSLRQKLEQAVQKEDYELAAELRDKINEQLKDKNQQE
jgi:protein arginine kinase activator